MDFNSFVKNINEFFDKKVTGDISSFSLDSGEEFKLIRMENKELHYRVDPKLKHPAIDVAREASDKYISDLKGITGLKLSELKKKFTSSATMTINSENGSIYYNLLFYSKHSERIPLSIKVFGAEFIDNLTFSVTVWKDLNCKLNLIHSARCDRYDYDNLATYVIFNRYESSIKKEFGVHEDRNLTAELVMMQYI